MKIKRLLMPAVAATAMLLGSTACNSEGSGGTIAETYADMVTLERYSSEGMTMTYQTGQYTPLITLVTRQRIDTTYIKVGDRFVALYELPDGTEHGKDGLVELRAYARAANDTVRYVDMEKYSGWANTPSRTTTVWVTGQYINMQGISPSIDTYVNPQLLADKSTLDGDNAQLYIYFPTVSQSENDAAPVYASYNITKLLKAYPNLRSLTVHSPGQAEPLQVALRVGMTPGN